MQQFFRSTFFNFEAVRILSTAGSGGAEIGEFLEAVSQINENKPESWHDAWIQQAQNAEVRGREALACGDKAAARGAFLRAANYTRASAYMLVGDRTSAPPTDDHRTVPILHRVAELFDEAIRLFDAPVHKLSVPYITREKDRKVTLPAFLYLPPSSCRLPGKTPVLINPLGADSLQEEMYHMFPAAGPALGYAVLTYEGPGQGLTLREHNVPMQGDWEEVNGAVIDYLEEYARENEGLELDLDRIAVAGASLGGYFALRSASDPRIKACVALDPPYDFYDFGTNHVAPAFFRLWDQGWVADSVVNAFITLGTWTSFQTKWEMFTTSRLLGAASPAEMLRSMQTFTLKGTSKEGRGEPGDSSSSFLSLIKCPVFVTGAAHSLYFDVEANTEVIFQGLPNGNKEKWVGKTAGDGGIQAKMGALALCNQRSFGFLDRQFAISRQRIARE